MPTPVTRVFMLMNWRGHVCSVYASQADAEAKREKFNADPYIEADRKDPDAPYSVAVWCVKDAGDV